MNDLANSRFLLALDDLTLDVSPVMTTESFSGKGTMSTGLSGGSQEGSTGRIAGGYIGEMRYFEDIRGRYGLLLCNCLFTISLRIDAETKENAIQNNERSLPYFYKKYPPMFTPSDIP